MDGYLVATMVAQKGGSLAESLVWMSAERMAVRTVHELVD